MTCFLAIASPRDSSKIHSRHLNSKVKILCYQTLIRPIITYGCPIWYNIPASLMEKIRIFERKCIRAYLSIYRSEHSGYKKYEKNKKIYDLANIHRIDCHILKLTRNHFVQAAKIKENSLIFGCLFPNDAYYKHTLIKGYIPPPRSFSIPRQKKLSPRPK